MQHIKKMLSHPAAQWLIYLSKAALFSVSLTLLTQQWLYPQGGILLVVAGLLIFFMDFYWSIHHLHNNHPVTIKLRGVGVLCQVFYLVLYSALIMAVLWQQVAHGYALFAGGLLIMTLVLVTVRTYQDKKTQAKTTVFFAQCNGVLLLAAVCAKTVFHGMIWQTYFSWGVMVLMVVGYVLTQSIKLYTKWAITTSLIKDKAQPISFNSSMAPWATLAVINGSTLAYFYHGCMLSNNSHSYMLKILWVMAIVLAMSDVVNEQLPTYISYTAPSQPLTEPALLR